MANVRFLKDPGFLYDLFFLFVLRFNKEYCLKNCVSRNNKDADIEYYNKLDSELGEISDKLLPFFYLKEDNACFMTQHYLDAHIENALELCNFPNIVASLGKSERLVEQMIRYYFPEAKEETISVCKMSYVGIARLIDDSTYNSDVKSALYSFFLSPERTIQTLICELTVRKQLLTQTYEKHLEEILALYEHFNAEKVISVLSRSEDQGRSILNFDETYVSFCIVVKNCIRLDTYDSFALLLLCSQYEIEIDALLAQNQRPALDLLGSILSEANRIELLDLVAKKGEVTIHDIEEELGMAGTNAYYHLSMMLRAGMVKTRNRGRTLLYSFNEEYFVSVANELLRYIGQK